MSFKGPHYSVLNPAISNPRLVRARYKQCVKEMMSKDMISDKNTSMLFTKHLNFDRMNSKVSCKKRARVP